MFSVLSMTFRIWSTVKLGISRGRILRISHHPRGVRTQNLKAKLGGHCGEIKSCDFSRSSPTFEKMVGFFLWAIKHCIFFNTTKGTLGIKEFTHFLDFADFL